MPPQNIAEIPVNVTLTWQPGSTGQWGWTPTPVVPPTSESWNSSNTFARINTEPEGTRFRALLAIEDKRVTDGRKIMAGALFTRQPPLPLMFLNRNTGAHDDSVFVGNILRVWREGNEIWGEGVFDDSSEFGREAARLVREGRLTGISIDSAVLDSNFITEEDEDGYERIVGIDIMSMELLGATIVPFPAFEGTYIEMVDSDEELVASALPHTFSVKEIPEAFEMAEPSELTPWTVDGNRVYGHLAPWGSCHVGVTDKCVVAPKSKSEYSRFLIGKLDGRRVGVITMNTTHAPGGLNRNQTERHYADTGTVAAYVTIHDGELGPWVSGVLDDDLSEANRRRLAACGISGDWRKDPMTNSLELVSILAVPTPGFSVPRNEDSAMLVASAIGHCAPCSEREELEMPKEEFDVDETETAETTVEETPVEEVEETPVEVPAEEVEVPAEEVIEEAEEPAEEDDEFIGELTDAIDAAINRVYEERLEDAIANA
jgi:hypothetical protein